MSATNIEWADAVWNPTIGCRRVAPGCANCYAVPMAGRIASMHAAAIAKGLREAGSQTVAAKYSGLTVLRGNGVRDWSGEVRCLPERLAEPLHWRTPRRVFVNSMSDLFYGDAGDEEAAQREGRAFTPVPVAFIDQVFAVMALCRRHTFIVLTKRAGRMREYTGWADRQKCVMAAAEREFGRMGSRVTWGDVLDAWQSWPLPNVILGVSISEQASADALIPELLGTPAACRAVSYEPALGAVHFEARFELRSDGPNSHEWLSPLRGMVCSDSPSHGYREFPAQRIGWVIFGGESGDGARPCDVAWARSTRDQCLKAGVPFFLKQLGADPFVTLPSGEWLEGYLDSGVAHDHWGPPGDAECHFRLRDRKGGDPIEWPADLRVREWPDMAVRHEV